MSKSIKLKDNNYIDSSGVVHNKITLDKYLKTYRTSGTSSSGVSYPYRKILTIKLREAYETVFLKFVAVETENVGFIFNGEILAHLDVNKICTSAYFNGSYTYRNDTNMKMIMYLENNTAGNVTLSLYCYMPFNWRTINLMILGAYDLDAISEDNSYSSSEPSYSSKKEI